MRLAIVVSQALDVLLLPAQGVAAVGLSGDLLSVDPRADGAVDVEACGGPGTGAAMPWGGPWTPLG